MNDEREQISDAEAVDIELAKAINGYYGELRPIQGKRPVTKIRRQYYGVADLVAAGVAPTTAQRIIREINNRVKAEGGQVLRGIAHRDAIKKIIPDIQLDEEREVTNERVAEYVEYAKAHNKRARVLQDMKRKKESQ